MTGCVLLNIVGFKSQSTRLSVNTSWIVTLTFKFQPKVSPPSLVNILNDCSEDIIETGLQLSKAV